MIRFECDYAEGAAPQILERLTQTNLEQTPGYAVDKHCQRARELIREACGAPQAAVEFLVGGTQTNQTVISAALRPYQGVLCAQTGHINTHETGAIEATGHKVLALPTGPEGKLTAAQVEEVSEEVSQLEEPEPVGDPQELPTIIAVMNESFTDMAATSDGKEA